MHTPTTEDHRQRALQALQIGKCISIREAAHLYGVDQSTISRRVRGGLSAQQAHEKEQKLYPSEENALTEWCQRLSRGGFSVRHNMVRDMAEYLLNLRASEFVTIGNSWMRQFLKTRRTKQLRVILSKPTEHSRTKVCTPANFHAWFDVFCEHKQLYNIQDSDIYNVDETGFRMGDTARSYVVVDIKDGYMGYTPIDRGESLMVIECGSADGFYIPPFVILKGKHLHSLATTAIFVQTPHNIQEVHEASIAAAVLALGSLSSKIRAKEINNKIAKCAEETLDKLAIAQVEHQELVDANEENRKK
jgi:transposase